MAVTLVESLTPEGNLAFADATVNFTQTLQEDDHIYVLRVCDTGGLTAPTDAGYEQVFVIATPPQAGLYVKRVGSTADTSVTLPDNANTANDIATVIVILRGAPPGVWFQGVGVKDTGLATASTATPPAHDVHLAGSYICTFGCITDNGPNIGVTASPSGYTDTQNVQTDDASNGAAIGFAGKTVDNGTETPGAFTFNSSDQTRALSFVVGPSETSTTRPFLRDQSETQTSSLSDPTVTIDPPVGTQENDILLLQITTYVSDADYAARTSHVAPTDWGEVGKGVSDDTDQQSAAQAQTTVWWKRAGASETAVTVPAQTGRQGMIAKMSAWGNCVASGDPFANVGETDSASASGQTSLTTAGITTGTDNSMHILAVGLGDNTDVFLDAENADLDWQSRAYTHNTADGFDHAVALFYGPKITAGSVTGTVVTHDTEFPCAVEFELLAGVRAGVDLLWSVAAPDADELRIYRDTATFTDASLPAVLATVTPATEVAYTDDTVVGGTEYFYGVASVQGSEIALSNILSITPAGDGANAPAATALLGYATLTKTADDTSQTFPVFPVEWDAAEEVGAAVGSWSSSPNPGRITIPAGVSEVRFTASVELASGTRENGLFLDVRKNGALLPDGDSSAFSYNTATVGYSAKMTYVQTAILEVVQNDYFEVRINKNGNSGGDDILSSNIRTYFFMEVVA